jgi:hypothetical protein
MQPPPFREQSIPMPGHNFERPACVARVAGNRLANVRAEQIYHHDPSGTEDMDMRGRVIVQVDHDPQPVDAKDGRHPRPYPNPTSQETEKLVRGFITEPSRRGKSAPRETYCVETAAAPYSGRSLGVSP